METVTDQLRLYATAIADPTRGAILIELDRLGEATATQLADRLGLTANNVYHHMRVLRELGVVDEPRVVPGPTYIEKYYQIPGELRAALRLDPRWFDRAGAGVTAEDRQARLVALCLTMSNMLRRAARQLAAHDAGELDQFIREQESVMLSINRLSPEQLAFRIQALHEVLEAEDRRFAEDVAPRTEMMLLAVLPSFVQDKDPES